MNRVGKLPPQGAQKAGRPSGHLPKSWVLQAKTDAAPRSRQLPAPPPVYRPQPVPRILQTKMAASPQPVHQTTRAPAAPTAYRPQPVPRVLQLKKAGGLQPHTGKPSVRPVAPPVFRPQPKPAPHAPAAVQMKPNAFSVIQLAEISEKERRKRREQSRADREVNNAHKYSIDTMKNVGQTGVDKIKSRQVTISGHGSDSSVSGQNSNTDKSLSNLASSCKSNTTKTTPEKDVGIVITPFSQLKKRARAKADSLYKTKGVEGIQAYSDYLDAMEEDHQLTSGQRAELDNLYKIA